MSSIQCPACKKPQEANLSNCKNCMFPFTGSEQEKSKHIGLFINKKSIVHDAENAITRSRKILFLIAAYNFLFITVPFISPDMEIDIFAISINVILALGFIMCALLLKRSPMFFTIFPLCAILGLYAANFLYDPDLAMRGIIFKLVIIGSLIYSIYLLQEAKKFNNKFAT